MVITNKDNLPTSSYLLTSKNTRNIVIIKDKIKYIKNSEDNKEKREEEVGRYSKRDENVKIK